MMMMTTTTTMMMIWFIIFTEVTISIHINIYTKIYQNQLVIFLPEEREVDFFLFRQVPFYSKYSCLRAVQSDASGKNGDRILHQFFLFCVILFTTIP